jgi:hypothetical protein
MKTCFRWILLFASIGGGYLGLMADIEPVSQSGIHDFATGLCFIAALIEFAFITTSALLFADNPKCTTPLMVALILQIPWISSPVLVYWFGAGFYFVVEFIGGHFHGTLNYGSQFALYIQHDDQWGIGINLFAIVFILLLMTYRRTPNKSPEPTAVGAVSSASRFTAFRRRWLSFLR